MTSCESFFHLRQQLLLCVGDEGQGGAWVVCPRCPTSEKRKHTHGSQRRLDEIILKCDFAETTLTSRLGGCTTLRLWGNQN